VRKPQTLKRISHEQRVRLPKRYRVNARYSLYSLLTESTPLSTGIRCRRLHDNHNNKRRHGDRKSDKGNQHDRPSAGREFALHDPVLALEVSVVAQEQDQDADGEERRAERPAEMLQRVVCAVARPRQGRVEPEELGNGDSYGGEGQGSPEPGEECAFWEKYCVSDHPVGDR